MPKTPTNRVKTSRAKEIPSKRLQIPSLPLEIWYQILEPDPNLMTLSVVFMMEQIENQFNPNSKLYRNLRLVNKMFNTIISKHVFHTIKVKHVDPESVARLEKFTVDQDIFPLVKEYVSIYDLSDHRGM